MLHWTVHLNIPETHSYAAVAAGHRMYAFGGYRRDGTYGDTDPISVLVFNTVPLRWTALADTTKERRPPGVPSMRYGHRAVLVGNAVYIWGGITWDERFCTVLYAFDIDSRRWSAPWVRGAAPSGRWGHSACVLAGAAYVFGGYSPERLVLDDTYRLDPPLGGAAARWTRLDTRGSGGGGAPAASACHSATAIRGRMFVFGGLDAGGALHDGVRVFDAEAGRWLGLGAAPSIPEARAQREGHSAFAYNGELYVFGIWASLGGGLWKFNPESTAWRRVEARGHPRPHSRMCCCLVGERLLVVFGETRPHDLYVLDLSPSLKTLCKLAVLQHGLPRGSEEGLPHDVCWELAAMT